jgi:hypothetical protein
MESSALLLQDFWGFFRSCRPVDTAWILTRSGWINPAAWQLSRRVSPNVPDNNYPVDRSGSLWFERYFLCLTRAPFAATDLPLGLDFRKNVRKLSFMGWQFIFRSNANCPAWTQNISDVIYLIDQQLNVSTERRKGFPQGFGIPASCSDGLSYLKHRILHSRHDIWMIAPQNQEIRHSSEHKHVSTESAGFTSAQFKRVGKPCHYFTIQGSIGRRRSRINLIFKLRREPNFHLRVFARHAPTINHRGVDRWTTAIHNSMNHRSP